MEHHVTFPDDAFDNDCLNLQIVGASPDRQMICGLTFGLRSSSSSSALYQHGILLNELHIVRHKHSWRYSRLTE